MFWTVLAVGLGAHGWWTGSWIEIGFGIFAGVIGVRRAVMQWDKPGAFANCVATIVTFGFLITSMVGHDQERARNWQQERSPAQTQKQARPSSPALATQEQTRPLAPAHEKPKGAVQMFPSMDELAEEGGSIASTMEMWPMQWGEEYPVNKQGKECAIQVQWEGSPMSERPLLIDVQVDANENVWVDYETVVRYRNASWVPWQAKKVRVHTLKNGNAKNPQYMLWCSDQRAERAQAAKLKQADGGKISLTVEKALDVSAAADAPAEFTKQANCMVQIGASFSADAEAQGATYAIEYKSVGRTFWEPYDMHLQYGEESLIWDELQLRVVAKTKKPAVKVEKYCKDAGLVAWRRLDFTGRVRDGHILDGASSERVTNIDAVCYVRLKFRTDDIDAGEIMVGTKNGAGREIWMPYNALSLPSISDEFFVIVKRGMVRDGMEFALECPKF